MVSCESLESQIHLKLLSPLSKKIVRTILYFDIFDHPIKKEEIAFFATNGNEEPGLESELNELVASNSIFSIDDYFSAKPDFQNLIKRRIEGERIAQQHYDKALGRAKFIGKFPYVRAAYISGSMSKGVMHQDGDVDYFIVTEPGRLWVARTFLVLFKKVFLFNSRKFFCLNYFIDSSRLEIEEKNLFTATETVTLKPVYDNGVYKNFREANKWVESFIPNPEIEKVVYNGETKRHVGSLLESMLNNSFGDKLDEWFMNGTLKVWKRKFNHMQEADFEVALKTRKYVSKHHPQNFQRRVLQALEERVQAFEKKHDLKLAE